MARQWVYKCTRCGEAPSENNDISRDMLVSKTAVFKSVGFKGKTIRSRVVDWLCPSCLEQDSNYATGERSFIDTVAQDVVGHVQG